MPTLADNNNCTACGACAVRCPGHCITMKEDNQGVIYPSIDTQSCVNCGVCENVCPILNPVISNPNIICYAAWNSNPSDRATCASGGIANAIYKYFIDNGNICVGASMNPDWTVSHKIVSKLEELEPLKNSKYSFSEAYYVFRNLSTLLKDNKQVVMIGLPCQIAAARKLFNDNPNLILIDIVCHGSVPNLYLRQHIEAIEKRLDCKAHRISFRAPEKGTANYFLTLYDENDNIIYSHDVSLEETYNAAFHWEISYRENCYNCKFANPNRVSDITLGDFHGLGSLAPCSYKEDEVSTIIVHTSKGQNIIETLIAQQRIVAEERPVMESITGDKRLQYPSEISESNKDFQRLINKNLGDFEKTIKQVFKIFLLRRKFKFIKYIPNNTIDNIVNLCSK